MGDPNLLRVLISTDNHLGYAEKDAVLGDDSFRNFEEVLRTAKEMDVDFVLLGGDLFHDAEPSKHTFVQADRLLSQYCLYDKEVQFRILNDQSESFVEGRVNFENPNLRVGMPVFSIHGNHDYPHGEKSLSAMNVPSASGLINYFGKKAIDDEGTLTLAPILIQKGETRMALYGLGHIADQRVGTVFRKPGAVRWIPPAVASGDDGEHCWFSAFVLHQNRVQRGFSNTQAWIEDVHLSGFDELDFVLWGHEHQCIQETQQSSTGSFEVLQPGSTVATSLAEGESDPKHVFMLEVKCREEGEIMHRVTKHRLRSVRPFKFETVILAEQHGVRSTAEHTIKDYVRWKLEAMVTECERRNTEMLPLVRLRIDYGGFNLIRSQEIQKSFTGRVANPDDMLLWFKKPKKKQKQVLKANAVRVAEVRDTCHMDELVMAELDGHLKVLSAESCTNAFQSVVLGNSNSIIHTVFNKNVEKVAERVMDVEEVVDEETAVSHIRRIVAMLEVEAPPLAVTFPHESDTSTTGAPLLPEMPSRRRTRENDEDESMLDDELQSTNETPPPEPAPPVIKQEPSPPPRTRVSQRMRSNRGLYKRRK